MDEPAGAATGVRDYDANTDAAWLLAANNAHALQVGALTAEALDALTAMALVVRIAERGGVPMGVLVGFDRTAAYDSLNYRWFVERDEAPFFYVDRVFVEPEAAGLGIGRALYEDAARTAAKHEIGRLVCEVNERPANPGSMAFHAAMGFSPIVSRDNAASGKRVVMMEKRLGGGSPAP